MSLFWTTVGMSAATLTMFSFIPQIIKVTKTKSARDMSLVTLLQLTFGVFLWVNYGIYLKDPIIIIANLVTLITLLMLLFLFFKYGRTK